VRYFIGRTLHVAPLFTWNLTIFPCMFMFAKICLRYAVCTLLTCSVGSKVSGSNETTRTSSSGFLCCASSLLPHSTELINSFWVACKLSQNDCVTSTCGTAVHMPGNCVLHWGASVHSIRITLGIAAVVCC